MKPNILLLTVDALRADALAAYAGGESCTPHLDRLAGRSMLFKQAITNGTWTQAAIPPLLTSSYAGFYGGCLGSLSAARPSPVRALQQNGYRTVGISSNPWLSRRFGYDRGFDRFQDLVPDAHPLRLHRIRGGQALLRKPFTHRVAGRFGKRLTPPPVYMQAEHVNRVVLDAAREPERPFFIWVHYMDIHWPYHMEPALITPREIARAWRDIARFHAVSWGNARISGREVEHFRSLYFKSLSYLDEQIGNLMLALQQTADLKNTVILLLADHGEEFMDHGQLGHLENNFYEEIVRIPFWIHLPGQHAPRESSVLVQPLDLMPTILDLCACPAPDGLEGASLVPLLTDGAAMPERDHVIIERPRPGSRMLAVRTSSKKYIWSEESGAEDQLFDLDLDPYERENRIREHPDLASSMRSVIMQHLSAIEAQGTAASAGSGVLGNQLEERLRGLGYLE